MYFQWNYAGKTKCALVSEMLNEEVCWEQKNIIKKWIRVKNFRFRKSQRNIIRRRAPTAVYQFLIKIKEDEPLGLQMFCSNEYKITH